jgi:hypothetical protein
LRRDGLQAKLVFVVILSAIAGSRLRKNSSVIEQSGKGLPDNNAVDRAIRSLNSLGRDSKERCGLVCAQTRSPAKASDRSLDRIKLGDPTSRLGGDRRGGRLVYILELASGVSPAGGQYDIAAFGQPFEACITVDLQNAAPRPAVLRLAENVGSSIS